MIKYLHNEQIQTVIDNQSKYRDVYISYDSGYWHVIDTRKPKLYIKSYISFNTACLKVLERQRG